MEKNSKIYIAGHTGLVGSAITKTLKSKGYTNLLTRDISELDLTNQAEVKAFFDKNEEKFRIGTEIKASHILVETEEEALSILDKIKGGEKFAKLAKAHSKDYHFLLSQKLSTRNHCLSIDRRIKEGGRSGDNDQAGRICTPATSSVG